MKNEPLELYRRLVLIRRAEEKIREEYSKNEMKTPVHLGIGGEAIPVGVTHMLPPGSKTFATYRNHSLYLSLTGDTDGFFGELFGKSTGVSKGKAGSMHLSSPRHGFMAASAVVGTTIPVAVGAALANDYLKSGQVVAVFFGDGAMEEGVFWESLNFASLKKLRILFVCEDNGLAIHTPKKDRHGFPSIPGALKGFNCHTAGGDGSELEVVIRKTGELLKKMKRAPRPGFLHLTYYRFLEHVGPLEDYDAGYRPRPGRQKLRSLDPLHKFEKGLLRRGIPRGELEAIKKEVGEQIARSVVKAREAPFPPPEELFEDLFA